MMNEVMEEWRKYANTIMLAIIMFVVSAGSGMLIKTFNKVNDKLDALLITVTVHNTEAEMWKMKINENSNKIVALETGQHDATKDRYTKREALKALEDLRKWVDKYYERK